MANALRTHEYVGPEYEMDADQDELLENPDAEYNPDEDADRPATTHSLRNRSYKGSRGKTTASPDTGDDDEEEEEDDLVVVEEAAASKKQTQTRKRAPSKPKTTAKQPAKSRSPVSSRSSLPKVANKMVANKTAATPKAPRFKTAWAFPLLVLLSWIIGAVSHTLIDVVVGPELAPYSRSRTTTGDVVLVLGWKVLELAVFWFNGLDDLDTLCLTTLSGLPYFILLDRFYEVSRLHLILHLLSNIAQNVIPLRIFTRRNPYHTPFPHILRDPIVRLTTTLLGSVIYAIPLYFSLTTWLPVSLTTNFLGLKTLEHAHAATFFGATLSLIPIGFAGRKFLFDPSVHSSAYTSQAVKDWHAAELINPANASLAETLEHNILFWKGMHPRGRVLLHRTTLLALWTAANATFGAWIEIEGSEIFGAFAWGAIWSVGAALTGVVFGWVGSAF